MSNQVRVTLRTARNENVDVTLPMLCQKFFDLAVECAKDKKLRLNFALVKLKLARVKSSIEDDFKRYQLFKARGLQIGGNYWGETIPNNWLSTMDRIIIAICNLFRNLKAGSKREENLLTKINELTRSYNCSVH